MTSIPPVDANAHTEIDIEDSCNCCWGRRIKKKPPLIRKNGSADLFKAGSPRIVRDATEVYNLNVNVDFSSSTPKHKRSATTYPKEGYDADSTQSTQDEKK